MLSLQKQVKQSAVVLDNPSNELEVVLEFIEEQAAGTNGVPLSYSLVNSYLTGN